MNTKIITVLVLILAALAGTTRAQDDSTNTNAPAADGRVDTRSLQIISQKNIFNPNRRARQPQVRQPRIDYFTLNGTMTYEDKSFAFFDGSGQFRNRTLQPAQAIADYKISEITNNAVKLVASSNQVINFVVGMRMSREDNGPWKLSAGTSTPASAEAGDPTSSSIGGAPLGGGLDDVVKKLMERRAAEKGSTGNGEDK